MSKRKKTISAAAFKVRYLKRSRELYRRYLETRPWIRQLYKTFLGLRPGLRVVDVGCGTGDFTRYLAELIGGRCNIIGVDMRAASLRTAISATRKAGLASRVTYRKGDAYNIPVGDGFADLTCCRTLLMHLTDPLKAVKEMARVTKKGGIVAAVERGEMNAMFDPEDEEYTVLAEKLGKAYLRGIRKLEGKEYAIGDRLPSIFMKAGLSELQAEVQADPWLLGDSRRKLEDVKDELRFELQMYKETKRLERRVMIAGGGTRKEVGVLFQKYEARMKGFLSDDEKLRNSGVFYVGGLYLVMGRKI